MPRLQKKQGNPKQVTFAVRDTETDKQCLPELERIKTEQDRDPILRVVKQWVEDGARGTIQVNRVPDKLITYCTQSSLLKVDGSELLKRKWVSRKEKDTADKRTSRGYRYILTISDAWSNYLVAVPVRSQTAKENIAAIMKNWILKVGMCR